jgi:phage antirepressor YoqD-like protein
MPAPLSTDQLTKAREAYEGGLGLRNTAKLVGVDPERLRQALIDADVPIRGAGRVPKAQVTYRAPRGGQ